MFLQHSNGSIVATLAGKILISVESIGEGCVDKDGNANGL